MTDAEIRTQILAFSAHLRNASERDATEPARRHGWLDPSGEPTPEGCKLVEALEQKDAPRAAYMGSY